MLSTLNFLAVTIGVSPVMQMFFCMHLRENRQQLSGAIMTSAECQELGSCSPLRQGEITKNQNQKSYQKLKSINMVKKGCHRSFLGMLSPNLASVLSQFFSFMVFATIFIMIFCRFFVKLGSQIFKKVFESLVYLFI